MHLSQRFRDGMHICLYNACFGESKSNHIVPWCRLAGNSRIATIGGHSRSSQCNGVLMMRNGINAKSLRSLWSQWILVMICMRHFLLRLSELLKDCTIFVKKPKYVMFKICTECHGNCFSRRWTDTVYYVYYNWRDGVGCELSSPPPPVYVVVVVSWVDGEWANNRIIPSSNWHAAPETAE